MSKKTYVVVGGVAGGAGVAARIRRRDEEGTIILFEQGPYVSFANCGLPYYAGGVIQDRKNLLVTPIETLRDVFRIDVHTQSKVTRIDPKRKLVTVVSDGAESSYPYDELVLSPGAKPFVPPIAGVEDEAVLTVRSIPDIDKVVGHIAGARRATVVGGGFIGIEMAENLVRKGLSVSLVEAADQCMTTLDPEMAASVHRELSNGGVELHLASSVQAIIRQGSVVTVRTSKGDVEGNDFVILAIGVRPDSTLAKDAGLALDGRGYILVNERFQSSDPHIYAIGDAIAYPSPFDGKPIAVALAGPANKMARLCADSMVSGTCTPYPGTYGASIAKVFDLEAGSVGLNERQAGTMGYAYAVAVTHGMDHASYYPGAKPLSGKIIYEKPSGRLLGGQMVGYGGVVAHVDVLSALIAKGGTVYDLAAFEQAYAPPFGSAKDILNMLGFIATNCLEGLDQVVTWNEADRMVRDDHALVVDVRTPDEVALGSYPGALPVPHREIRDRMEEIPTDRPVILMCAIGLRGHIALRILRQHGYTQVWNMTGGYKTWSAMHETVLRNAGPTGHREHAAPSRLVLDACGLSCPGPIVALKGKMDMLKEGDVLEVHATDPGFANDVVSWCSMTGNTLLDSARSAGMTIVHIRKGARPVAGSNGPSLAKGASIIVFSNDFDKVFAAFVLANGAAASGKPAVMFFTFWGLSVLRKQPGKRIHKSAVEKMFGAMLPKDMDHLGLSKMRMGGMGKRMMRKRMRVKQVAQLRAMYEDAKRQGVRFIACQMSMDVMGLTKEELLDGVEVGGVGTYMQAASSSDVNLFI